MDWRAEHKRKMVRESALLLDDENPGWEWTLVPDDITTIYGPRGCVLHKLYGGYRAGLRALSAFGEESRNSSRQFGFCCPLDLDSKMVAWWHEEILTRRASQVTLPPKPPVLSKVVEQCLALAK